MDPVGALSLLGFGALSLFVVTSGDGRAPRTADDQAGRVGVALMAVLAVCYVLVTNR